ncbi:MAG: N-acetylmuramoyl-L-alanine amidase-like domain-containing protein [Candidatus Kapaibacterium sp.]
MNRRNFFKRSTLLIVGATVAERLSTSHLFAYPDKGETTPFEGEDAFRQLIEEAKEKGWSGRPIGEVMGHVGLALLTTPYVAGTLDKSTETEVCTANLLGLDCVTFFETTLAAARIIKGGKSEPEDLLSELTRMRYRNGEVTDYTSRLHYVVEWYSDNQKRGIVQDITSTLPGAKKYDKLINFMSRHTDAYKQLKGNAELIEKIKKVEDSINEVEHYYIPKNSIREMEDNLQTGDIVAITTTIIGLDVSHTGLCYRDQDDRLRLLHASLTQKQVFLDTDLHTYLAGNSKQTGIMVARPLEVGA